MMIVLTHPQVHTHSPHTHPHPTHTDLIRDIKDPEHPHTLEELNVVREDAITISHPPPPHSPPTHSPLLTEDDTVWIRITFTPTVPHCSLATLIGLCLRVKLERSLQYRYKLDIVVCEGSHSIEEDVNKQINDKERVAAAMENPNLRDMVEQCIQEVEY